ncbi:MAG: hypothetical protein DDT30_02107 [Dehalococcoidia bacterium]|nr:hypothetical protein [Bacillota bacterium]
MTSAEELGFDRSTCYFQYRGEVNTQKALELSRDRARQLNIGKMVVASETGRSALRALKVLEGTDIKLIVVTHYPGETRGPKGDIPIGLGRPEYRHVKEHLLKNGAVVVQGTRPFAGVGRTLGWNSPVPVTFVDKALELFGPGTKIAVEVALMATDVGVIEDGETVVTLGGTYKGLDTALVVKTTYSGNIFTNFEVLELIAKPRRTWRRLPEYEQENWKGDLEQYYKLIGIE